MLSRRQILQQAGIGLLSATLAPALSFARSVTPPQAPADIKAIAFDAFPIFDPRPIFKNVQDMFPEKGEALRKLWFTKQFGYTWLRTSGAQYKNFWRVIEDALDFAADDLGISLSAAQKEKLMQPYLALPVWPDVKPALQKLHAAGIRLSFLSNMTEDMLRQNMAHNGISDLFEFTLSTDTVQAFKPAPQAYQLAVDAFRLPKENIAFAAFAGWDAVGAKWFGYPTAWINRMDFSAEKLDATPDITTKDFSGLLDFSLRDL